MKNILLFLNISLKFKFMTALWVWSYSVVGPS